MATEAVLIAASAVLGLALLISLAVIYRMGRSSSALSPVLDQRLTGIEGAIARSDSLVRDEFGRGRTEVQESARSLREEVATLFGTLAASVRGSIADLASNQNARLAEFAQRLDTAKDGAAAHAKALR